MLRAALNPEDVSVIPNAIISELLVPDPSARDPNFGTYTQSVAFFKKKVVLIHL